MSSLEVAAGGYDRRDSRLEIPLHAMRPFFGFSRQSQFSASGWFVHGVSGHRRECARSEMVWHAAFQPRVRSRLTQQFVPNHF